MKKNSGENSKRNPQVGDLVKFDITWCEGLDSKGNIYGTETMMQYGIVTNVVSRASAEASMVKRIFSRYHIVWKGINLMYFGNDDHIEVVEKE